VLIQMTKPPNSRSVSDRFSGARKRCGASATTFFCGCQSGRILGGLRQQTGDQLIGQLLKSLMDRNFELGEAFGLRAQLPQPQWLGRT